MTDLNKYWQFYRLNSSGKLVIKEKAQAKRFLQEKFPQFLNQTSFSDQVLQEKLFQEHRKGNSLANICLRCFISNQITKICNSLAKQFGENYQFKRNDLLPFVLDDLLRSSKSLSYKSTAMKILETFDPQQSSLATWTKRMVRNNTDLNRFLLECGLYLISDWAILNDTRNEQLERIFREFHNLDETAIASFSALLTAYHQIYRQDRLNSLATGKRTKCQPPSVEQLQKIKILLKSDLEITDILKSLEDMASKLREYRIFVRGGKLQQKSLDNPDNQIQLKNREELQNQDHEEFLQNYRRQFLLTLNQAIEEVLSHWLAKKKRKKPKQFLTALELFHCKGYSMTEIAGHVGLQKQYQVSRLLELKNFRADIRQKMLQKLRTKVPEIAASYTHLQTLTYQEKLVNAALEEQVEVIIKEAETEAAQEKKQPFSNILAQNLCAHLDQRGNK